MCGMELTYEADVCQNCGGIYCQSDFPLHQNWCEARPLKSKEANQHEHIGNEDTLFQ
jgi:hypothetical protein